MRKINKTLSLFLTVVFIALCAPVHKVYAADLPAPGWLSADIGSRVPHESDPALEVINLTLYWGTVAGADGYSIFYNKGTGYRLLTHFEATKGSATTAAPVEKNSKMSNIDWVTFLDYTIKAYVNTPSGRVYSEAAIMGEVTEGSGAPSKGTAQTPEAVNSSIPMWFNAVVTDRTTHTEDPLRDVLHIDFSWDKAEGIDGYSLYSTDTTGESKILTEIDALATTQQIRANTRPNAEESSIELVHKGTFILKPFVESSSGREYTCEIPLGEVAEALTWGAKSLENGDIRLMGSGQDEAGAYWLPEPVMKFINRTSRSF